MFCDKKIPTPPLSPPLHGWGTGSSWTKGKAIGREKRLCCPLSPYISLYLLISPSISLYLLPLIRTAIDWGFVARARDAWRKYNDRVRGAR